MAIIYVAGIDAATSTGWSILKHDTESKVTTVEACGQEDFSARKGESGAMIYVKFNTWLHEFLGFMPPLAMVGFEMPHVQYKVAATILYGLVTRIMEACERKQIPCSSVEAPKLKMFATGKGNAKKDKMIEAANAAFGLSLTRKQDDTADAIHAARYILNLYGTGNGGAQ